jgi:hypothetical protein
MSTFVEECRREWKRLGVPELLADEMATDLEADLAEAHADGVSAAEILGESDPRRFATAWASERGLVSEQPPKKSRKRFWVWLAVALAVLFVVGVAIPVVLATVTVHSSPSGGPVRIEQPRPMHAVRVPNFVGMTACHAERIALAVGITLRYVPKRRCNAVVVAQRPAPGALVPRHTPQAAVALRLRLRS